MTLGIIEINDTGIQVALEESLILTSPGYAVLDGDKLLVGSEGVQYARLLPRWTNNRFWNQLDTNPIANAAGPVRHHADLAFAHMEQLWGAIQDDADQVMFLVPSFYSRDQIGLLLGMAQECGMPVSGVVDTSVAAASEQPLRESVLHLDIHLHRITLTRLTYTASLARSDVTTVAEVGLFTLWDRWANIVANQFIQSSRYDPLHEASSEQALYDALPDWIRELDGTRSNPFSLKLQSTSHSVTVSADQLMAACAALYPQIVQAIRNQIPDDQAATLLVSHRFEGFPGLMDSLSLIGNADITVLSPADAISGAQTHRDKILGSGGVTHVVNLPVTAERVVSHLTQERRATHLLHGHHAVAIGSLYRLSGDLSAGIQQDLSNPVCTFYTRGNTLIGDVHDASRITCNGEAPSSDQITFHPGDELRIDDQPIQLIST